MKKGIGTQLLRGVWKGEKVFLGRLTLRVSGSGHTGSVPILVSSVEETAPLAGRRTTWEDQKCCRSLLYSWGALVPWLGNDQDRKSFPQAAATFPHSLIQMVWLPWPCSLHTTAWNKVWTNLALGRQSV